MIITLLATTLVTTLQGGFACPVMGGNANTKLAATDFRGVRYYYCCAGCNKAFEKEPLTYIFGEKAKGKLIGEALFDPVSGMRIGGKGAKAKADFEGIRYSFQSEANKTEFLKNPKSFAAQPSKELLHCAVMGHDIDSYDEAGGYYDYESVRYYTCCGDCLGKLKANPSRYTSKVVTKAKAPKPQSIKP